MTRRSSVGEFLGHFLNMKGLPVGRDLSTWPSSGTFWVLQLSLVVKRQQLLLYADTVVEYKPVSRTTYVARLRLDMRYDINTKCQAFS